jgi:hypothetical protein
VPLGKSPPIGRFRNYTQVYEWHDTAHPGAPGVVHNYTPIGTCWCSIKIRSGEMWLGAAQIDAEYGPRGTHIIQTRFREDLSTRHTMVIAGKRYRILGVRNDDARRYTEFDAELYGDADVIGAPPTTAPSGWDNGESIWDGSASEPWDPNGP